MRIMAPGGRARRLAIFLASTVVFGLLGPAASARFGTFHDPKDARTRLDLANVSLQFHPETRRYKWRFATHERFRLRNGGSFLLFVDSVGAGRWDYRLHVWYDGGHGAVAFDVLTRAGAGGADRFAPTASDIKPTFGWCGFKGIRRNKPVQWRVETVREQQEPFGDPLDRAPNIGWF